MYFWSSFNFLDSLNYYSIYLKPFHDLNLFFLFLLLFFILSFYLFLLNSSMMKMMFKELELIELIWTFFPCVILIFLGWPSLQLLYSLDYCNQEVVDLTFKATGHQWFWNYELKTNFSYLNMDSYMINTSDLKFGGFRSLCVDNKVVLPFNHLIRILVTSNDVLHAWTLPSMGVKADAIPGRINQMFLKSMYPMNVFGQCSELCGVKHSFMPIEVEFTSYEYFFNWSLLKPFSLYSL